MSERKNMMAGLLGISMQLAACQSQKPDRFDMQCNMDSGPELLIFRVDVTLKQACLFGCPKMLPVDDITSNSFSIVLSNSNTNPEAWRFNRDTGDVIDVGTYDGTNEQFTHTGKCTEKHFTGFRH